MAEERKVSGRAVAAGALSGFGAIGIWKLIEALRKPAEAAPPGGVQVVMPDEQTREALAAALDLLAAISTKLDRLDSLSRDVANIVEYLGAEVSKAQYQFRITDTEENLAIPGKTTKQLYATTAPEQGAIARIKLISTLKDIQYNLYIDNQRWAFNVSDMVEQSIEFPHFPGAWIEKATGAKYVFVFSSGDSMQVRFWDNFRLEARTTTDTPVTILAGQIVEKILL